MDIAFADAKLEKYYRDGKLAQRKLGPARADKFFKRVNELRAAVCLEDLRNLKQAGVHELSGDLKDHWAANLDHPYRLIFRPAMDPIPAKEKGGGHDWNQINSIVIEEIINYHD
jgi:proteic killer suppression protein